VNHEELLYAALDNRETGCVPTLSLLADPNIMNQALGRTSPSRLFDLLNSPAGRRFLDRYGGMISKLFNAGMLTFGSLMAAANHRMGFDGIMLMGWRGRLVSHNEIEDVFGRGFDLVDDGFGNPYMMYRAGLIETPDDWRAYPRPGIAAYARAQGLLYRAWRRIWNKRIAVVPFVGPGLWENSWQPMGFSRFVVMMRRDPGFVREAAGYFTSLTAAVVDEYCRAGARVLAFGDDLAYRSGPMLSVDQLEEYYGDGYRQLTATAHRYGAKIIIHCCGNTYELLEKFIEWGFDGAHAFEPTADNSLAAARDKVGDRLCLVGNIDITRTLVDGSREQVASEVEQAIKDSRGGGFILAPAHTHAAISVERVRWMLEAARR
jgi:hypothetical protein